MRVLEVQWSWVINPVCEVALKWLGIVTSVPNMDEFPHMCGQEYRTMSKACPEMRRYPNVI